MIKTYKGYGCEAISRKLGLATTGKLEGGDMVDVSSSNMLSHLGKTGSDIIHHWELGGNCRIKP